MTKCHDLVPDGRSGRRGGKGSADIPSLSGGTILQSLQNLRALFDHDENQNFRVFCNCNYGVFFKQPPPTLQQNPATGSKQTLLLLGPSLQLPSFYVAQAVPIAAPTKRTTVLNWIMVGWFLRLLRTLYHFNYFTRLHWPGRTGVGGGHVKRGFTSHHDCEFHTLIQCLLNEWFLLWQDLGVCAPSPTEFHISRIIWFWFPLVVRRKWNQCLSEIARHCQEQ